MEVIRKSVPQTHIRRGLGLFIYAGLCETVCYVSVQQEKLQL